MHATNTTEAGAPFGRTDHLPLPALDVTAAVAATQDVSAALNRLATLFGMAGYEAAANDLVAMRTSIEQTTADICHATTAGPVAPVTFNQARRLDREAIVDRLVALWAIDHPGEEAARRYRAILGTSGIGQLRRALVGRSELLAARSAR